MRSSREPFEDDWRDIAKMTSPMRSEFDNRRKSGAMNRAPQDEHGLLAFRVLAAGMTSGLTNPSSPWFTLAIDDEDMMRDQQVRIWLSDVEAAMYAFIGSTNFYGAVKSGYAENGIFGTESAVMLEHPTEGMVFHNLTAGQYWLSLGSDTRPDTLYRRCDMTIGELVKTFVFTPLGENWDNVSGTVKRLWDRSQYNEIVTCYHAMEPNIGRDITKLDGKNKPWRSYYWEDAETDKTKLLGHSGFDDKPFWAARWDTASTYHVYGYSPAMESYGSLKELQYWTKRRKQVVDFIQSPEKIVPANVKLTGQANNVVSASNVDTTQVFVPYTMDPRALPSIDATIDKIKNNIDMLSYRDLFMAITNMSGVQPRTVEEIVRRNEEKLTQLGPVIDRASNEKLEIVIDRVFSVMVRGGLLPPAPEVMQGSKLEVRFVSILHQMQRMVGLGQMERTAATIGNLAATFPEAADKLNVDEFVDEYGSRAGTPPKVIRSSEEVDKMREARAQKQQQQEALAAMPAMKQGAEAAGLLAELGDGNADSLGVPV